MDSSREAPPPASPPSPPTARPAFRTRGRAGLILRDLHFWVPVVVLIGGLLVLAWMR
ncbi:MAG TPA: hypothetical protein VJ867_03640 [Gemmatimonadaceae bacterium]|nr:hypothetical protein [Gemmatimonadaceae bacterium]